MKTTLVILLVTLCGLMGLALWHGTDTFVGGWHAAMRQLVCFVPVLLITMLLDGFTEVLLPHDIVRQWLSDSAGWRGMGLASLAGVLTPWWSDRGFTIGDHVVQGWRRDGSADYPI